MTVIVGEANDPMCDAFFRRGYRSGVDAVISGLVHKLSKDEIVKIEDWIVNELAPWSSSAETSVSLPPEFPRIDC